MPGLDELFDQKIQQSAGSAKEPIGTESFQSIDPFLQDYNKSVTSDKSLAGLMGANLEQGGLGDVSYFDEGRVYNNGNLDKARAANQPWYDKWGRAALKIVPGVALGIGEIAGHLLDFENYASMFTGAQNNYDNWFSKSMRSAREGLDEALPVYQRDAGKAWDPGDTGWWANNVAGLVESMAEFFAVNALTGGTVGAISKGSSIARTAVLARNAKLAKNIATMTPDKIIKAQQAIDKGTDIANMFNQVAQAGSAFEMGVAVSSMNATGTYQEVYNTAKRSINPLTNKPYTEEEAIKIASDSAATSFNTGLVFNSVLNYTSITPFFRGKAIPPKSKLAPIAGESTDDMLTRLKDLRANPDKLKEASKWYDKWYVDTASEMGQEALEEYGEALAGKIGVNRGMEQITGEKQEINYFSEDMLVAAGLGMLGGGIGKGFKSFFDRNNDSKIQDNLIKEVDYRIQNLETYKTAQTNLAKAKAENNEIEVAKAEEQLFTNQLFDAIINDNVETFVQQMEEIGKLSREDAKAKGFFVDDTDNLNEATSGDYRVKANAAIDLVKKGKVIATAVQQDGYLQTELKPLVLKEQLSAAFNEHVADGLKRDIAALEMKEVKYNSAGEPIAQPWVYGGNLQAKVDAIDSLVFREEQAIEQGKGNPKTLEYLKSQQSLFKAQLQQHINDQTAVGKKYDPTLSRQGLNYLQLSRKYRELMSVEASGLNSRNKLTKLTSLENQKATVEHLKNVERRLPKKVEIANKAKELMGKFFSLPSDADPQSKKDIMDQLNALLDSGAMEALDYVDPNDESGQSEFDTRQEILEEILGSMQSPEDLKRFIDEADLGSTKITYDENNQPITEKVDDGTVQHRRKVFDENGNPVLENVESTDVNGNPITTQRQVLENVGSKTTLADLFGRMQDINNRSNELRDTELASDANGKVNPFKALLLAMSETFDEDVKQTIAENKDKVKIAREKEKAKREEFAKDIFEQNYDEFISELGILEDIIMPNELGKIQEKFNALANRLLEMYGPAYLPVVQKIYSAINAMIPQFDTRYSNMSINQILEGVGGINENFVLPVVFSTRVLYKGKPIVRTEEGGYHYGTAKAIGEIEGEKLKHVPGTIEVINGKVVFIPESAIGLDDKAEYAVELSADALTKPLSELNIGVKMQESYDIQLAVSEDGNTALINFGGKSFKLSDINPENDFFFDESGEFLTGLYIEDADGIGHIITDPAMLTDLINIIGSYDMLFQEYAENNFTVSVVNVFGKKSVYKVVDFNAVKPEESVVVTDTGVDISHHKLKSEGGALTIKGRVLNELKRKFINDVVKKLSDEISQQQTIEPTETEGSQTDGQGPESQVDNQNNQRVRESQERVRRKEFTEEQKSKIDKYRDKYESKIKDLINSQDAEGLQQEFDKFEKISNYSGTSDEVIAQVEAAKAAMRLIYNGMKVINKSLEERGNDAVNNSKKVPTDKLDTKGFESANAGKDLYHDENGTDESPSILNNDFKLVTDGLEVKTKESLATPKQNDMAVVSDGEYTYVINYNNGKWEPVIVTDNNGSAAIVQKDSDKVKYIKPDGSQGEWDKSKFESNLSKFIEKPDITVHTISRDDAGKVWRKINDKLKNPKDTKEKQTQTVKKDLQVAGTRKDGVKLFTTPNVTESWQPPGRPNKYTVVSLNSTNTPTGVTINDEFITQQGLDMLHNPNVTSETHFVRFKAIENNWWKSQSDDTKKLRNELTPIYVELVDKLTGESVIVSRLASASKNGNLLPERSAILEALDKGQEVTAEIANEYGQNRMFSMQKDGYVHVLNIFDDSGAPVFYSMSDPNNGLINTWQLTKDGSFSKENKPSEIVLLTTKGMDANKSFGKSEKLQIDTKNQMSNADPKVRTALKQQLPSIDISNFTEGQIMMPMVTPAGVVTVVPLSTAFVTNDIINDFFLSPLKKMNGNAVSADEFDSFVENLRQIISVDSKPSKDPQSFFQVDKVLKDGKMIGSNIKFWSKKHNAYLTVALSNREGLSGLIHSLQNNLPIKATVTTVNGKGDFKGSKNTVDITSDDLMEVMAERKMNVQRDRLNSTAKFSITNPTTGEVQEFNSYNEFVMGLPSTDNKPNMLINDKKKSGPMTSILNHNFMNNNGTVFNGAGVVMNNLSVEVKKEKKQQQQPQQKPGEKKQERRTVTPKPVQGKSFNEVKKTIDEIQKVPKTIAVVGDISKKPVEDAADVITSAYGDNPTVAKQFLNNFGKPGSKITINDNVKISGTTVELLGKVDENTDEFKKLVRETYRYGLDLVVNGKLVASSINNKGKYVNLNTGQVYKRVTSVIKDKEFEGNALSDTAVDIGNKVDTILRKAFTLSSKGKFIYFTDLATGNLISKEKLQSSMQDAPENFPTTDVNEMYEFLKEVHDIRLAMEKRNELPFADNILLHNDELGIAGTVDLLTVDPSGTIRIYDFKTMRGNKLATTYEGKSESKYDTEFDGMSDRQYHQQQLSMYRILLANSYGLVADGLAIMPIEVKYAAGDTHSTTLKRATDPETNSKWIIHEPLDTVKGISINYPDGYLPVAEEVQEEEDAKNYEAEKQDSEKKPLVNKKSDTNGQVIEKTDAKLKGTKKSLSADAVISEIKDQSKSQDKINKSLNFAISGVSQGSRVWQSDKKIEGDTIENIDPRELLRNSETAEITPEGSKTRIIGRIAEVREGGKVAYYAIAQDAKFDDDQKFTRLKDFVGRGGPIAVMLSFNESDNVSMDDVRAVLVEKLTEVVDKSVDKTTFTVNKPTDLSTFKSANTTKSTPVTKVLSVADKKADIEKRIIITGTDGGFEIIDSSNNKNEQSGTLNDVRRRESDEKFEIEYGVGDNKNSLFSDMKFNDNNSYHFFVTDKKTNKRYYVVGISNRVIGNEPGRNGSLFASIEDNGNITELDRTLLELSLIEAFNKQVKKRPNIFEALPQEFIDKVNAKLIASEAQQKTESKSLRSAPKVEQQATSTFDPNDTEISKGALVNYNGKTYILWGTTAKGNAQLYDVELGQKVSGTPKLDNRFTSAGGKYKSVTHSNGTDYIYVDGKIISLATGLSSFENPTDPQRTQILNKFGITETSQSQETSKTTPTEPTPSALDSLFSLGAEVNTDEDEDMFFEDKGATNPINLQEFEEQSKPDSRIGKIYTSAVQAFKEAKDGDIFKLTTVTPSTRGHFTGKKGNMVESYDTVVKQGDYFIPWVDAFNKPENEQRKWDPKDLDKNNNKISLQFDGIFNKDVPFRRSNSTEAVIDTKKAAKWLRSRGIPFDESRQIIQVAQNANNAKVHGYFHNGLVYISSTAEIGTEYHEAFHAVFRTWNNDAQQRQLLDEAKSIYPQPTAEELQDLRELYPSLNDSQIEDLYYEEVLSEKFRQYVITNQKPRTITERIWKFIKDLFNYLKTYTSNKRTIDQLFSNIESGMINKQFTRVSQKAEKMYSRDKKGFNNKTRDHITNAITSAFVQKYDFAKDNGNDKPRASEIFKEIKDDFAIAGVERLAQCTQETDDDYEEFVKIAKNIGYEGEDGIRDLKIKMGAVYANVVKDLQTTNRFGLDSFANVPGVPNSVGDMMLTLLKQKHIAMPSLANTEKRLGHKITDESFAEVQKQYKEKKITAAEFNEVKKQRQGVLEAMTYFGVNNTWNSVKRDDDGFLLPEPGWIELASNQLNEFGLRVKGEISMEEIEAGEEKVYSRDSVEENRADMLSGKLKNFLARVPKPTAAGKILGIIPYNDRQETTAKFQALLTQSGGVSSMSQMLSILETASKTDPLVKNLYTEILKTMNSNKMEDKLMLNELYTLAAMTYRNFHSFQVRKSWKKDGFNLDVINFDSNSKRLTKKLVNDWKNNSYRPGSIYKVNESGEVTVDAVQLSALKAEFAKFNKKPKYELAELTAISNAFKILGVEMPVDTLQKAMQTGIKKSKDIIKGKNVIDYIVKDYSNSYKGSGRGFEAVISELSKGKDMHLTDISFFKKAAEVEGQFGGVENMSFTNSQGKNIFPINMHTAFTRNMGAIAFYGEGNDIQDAWLDSIALDPKVSFKSSSGVVYESPLYKLRNIPDSVYFTTLDAYKTSGEEHSNTAFQDFNEVNEWLYRLNAFANNGDKSSMYIMAPTIGDRSSNMLVKLPRIGFNKVASEYQSDVKTMLSTMIVQDIKSMQQAYEDIIMNTDKDGNLDTTNLIMYYHYNKDKQGNIIPGNWNKFSQLQFLNNTAAGKELIKLFSTTDDQQFLTDIKKADSLVNKAVADSIQYIESKTKDVVQRLSDLKIHEQVLKEKNGKTKLVDIKNPLDLKNYNSIEEFVKDFVTADLIMKNEIKKFTGADQLAYKGGAVEEYSKRMGHIMTPGTESAIEGEVVNEEYFVEFGDKPDYTMAIVDDVFSEDDSYEFMMALKDVPGVNSAAIEERINSTYGKNKSNKTDAMGYTTIHKHRAKLLGTRGWSPKHEEAYQNYNKGLEFAVYDKFGNVIQRPTLNPLKTYHDGIYNHNGKNVRVIVKHSTFPLLREFTKSHPRFEKLRARMEAEGEYSTLEPIDEVNHISGVKTGIINSNNTTGKKLTGTEVQSITIDSSTKINIYAGTGENAELSNFAERPVSNALGIKFKNVEAAFQYAKLNWANGDNSDIAIKLQTASGSEAKALGQKIKGLNVEAWDKNSVSIMKDIMKESFAENPKALNKLLATGNATLTHTQDKGKWGTEFPRLLMEIRDEFRNTQLRNQQETEFDFAEMKPMPFKLETKNQRIPQVIPDRVKVNKLGSQTMKLAPAGLSEFAESDYDIAGVNLKGKDVFDKYQQVLTLMQQNQIDNFYDRMGYNPEGFESMTSDEKLKFFNNFRRILKTVVEERGLSNNYLKTLDIVPDGRGGFEFAVPMAHPAYSKKFEQMMVSLFKNGPLTLPVNGKAFVQIAEFGTHVKDNSLKFIHSKNGKTIEAAEIAIPWEMADKMGLPKDENGDYDLSKLDQRLLTLVGYRIPTQGKSAMLPMKIKRILPKSMGKVILVPGEITAQMGSDFDVDKLYTLMPNYKVEYDAGAKKYNRTDEFGAHIMSRLDYKDKKAFTNTFTPDFIEQLWNNPEIIEDYITDINTDKSTEDLIEAVIKAKEDTIDDMKAMGISDKPKAVYTGYDINNVANNTQAQLENMLLDLTHGILKSPNHLQDVLSPVDSNTAPNLKKIAAGFIKGEKAMVNKLDANDPFTEITLALRNRVGKAGIGMYAVNMTGAAVAEYSNCQLAPQFEIKANGKVFNMLNRVKDDNGVSVIYSFSKHLTMAVDNAKDPQMAFLNDSLDTATVTSLFIRSGIVVPALADKLTEKLLKANINDAYSKAKTQEEKDELNKLAELVKENNTNLALPTAYGLGIIDFMSAKDLDFDGGPVEVATVMRLQPAVLKLTQEMQNNGYVNIEDGIAEMFLKYKSGVKDLKDAKTKAQAFLKDFKSTTMLDYVSMVDNIGNRPNLDDPKQLEILGNWALLSRAAREMMQVNKVIYNTDVIKNDMSSVAKISEIEDIKESIFKNEKPAVVGWTPNYPIAAKYSDTLDLMKDFISNFMPQGNDSFSVLGGSVKELLNKKTLKEEHYQELGKFVMPYLLAQPGSPVAKYFTPEFYGPLLYKGLGHRDNIVKQLNTVKTMILSDALPDLKDNKFLTLLDEHPDNKKSYKEEPILALKFETAGKITSSEQDDIIEDFHQLFNHPNEIVRKFADSLLAYNIVAKGLRSGVDSFADLIPIDVLNEKIDGKESINEYVRRVANSAFLERVYKSAATFIENNSHIDGLVGWVPSNAIMEFKDEDMIESNFLVPVDIATVEENKIQLPTYGFMYNDGKKELMKLVDIEGESYYSSREVINNNGKPVVTTIPIQKGIPYKMLNINNDVQGMVGLAQQIAEENEEYFEC